MKVSTKKNIIKNHFINFFKYMHFKFVNFIYLDFKI